MSIPFKPKINQRTLGQETLIFNEQHTIGVTAVSTSSPNYIRLIEVPLLEAPSSISIPGYVETTNPPTTNKFKVDYINGRILFDPSKNGLIVLVSYKGRGSIVDAEDIDELQDGVNTNAGTVTGVHADLNPDIVGSVHLVSGTNVTLNQSGNNITINSSGGGGGHTIQDEGTPLVQRSTLDFVGSGVIATDTGFKTQISIPGGINANPIYITANTTLALTDSYVLANVTANSIVVTLPTAIGNNGQRYEIKRIVTGGSPELNSFIVTIQPFGAETIDGNSNYIINTLDEGAVIFSDNANWKFETKHTRDKIWTGSATEYAAITPHDPHTVYIVV
jgi:hypothetical protein